MASPTQSDYHIGRVTERCAASGETLNPGDAIVSALVEREEDGELERQDFLASAWNPDAAPPRTLAHWAGVVPSEERGTKPTLDAGSALDLFDQLEDAQEPRRIAFRYLLALMLMRKRVLTLESGEPGRMLVRRKGDDPEAPAAEVVEPTISQDAIDELSPLVAQLVGIET